MIKKKQCGKIEVSCMVPKETMQIIEMYSVLLKPGESVTFCELADKIKTYSSAAFAVMSADHLEEMAQCILET